MTTTLPPCATYAPATTIEPARNGTLENESDDDITTGAIAIFGIFAVLLFAAYWGELLRSPFLARESPC